MNTKQFLNEFGKIEYIKNRTFDECIEDLDPYRPLPVAKFKFLSTDISVVASFAAYAVSTVFISDIVDSENDIPTAFLSILATIALIEVSRIKKHIKKSKKIQKKRCSAKLKEIKAYVKENLNGLDALKDQRLIEVGIKDTKDFIQRHKNKYHLSDAQIKDSMLKAVLIKKINERLKEREQGEQTLKEIEEETKV